MNKPVTVPTAEDIRAKASEIAYGKPLVENSYRGLIAEIIVREALGSEWRLCSADWGGWDLEHGSGCRLEVKQSAARQTWAAPKRPSPPSFDIRERTGYWEGSTWVQQPGRPAHIYVFAYHPVRDDSADHRDPSQWQFYVVPASRLPANKRISLSKLAFSRCSLVASPGLCRTGAARALISLLLGALAEPQLPETWSHSRSDAEYL